MARMREWNLSGYVRGAVLTASYLRRKLKMRLVAVVVSKSSMLYAMRMAKLAWRGAEILTAMTIQFIMGKFLWLGKGDAVIGTVSTQNTSNKRGKHLGKSNYRKRNSRESTRAKGIHRQREF
jgi:hypothetical protein